LGVISKGTEKPTRIMQLANVTWDDLIMYLEALIRNQLLSREVDGKRVTYSLTERGSSLLDHYVKLRQEAAPLGLEKLTKERISRGLTSLPTMGSQEADIYSALEKRIRGNGAKVLSRKVLGKSGAQHTLGLVTQEKDGSKHGYVVMRSVDEAQVMRLFVTQMDTELSLHAFYSGELSPETAALASAYSLELLPAEAPGSLQEGRRRQPGTTVDLLKLAGKSLLLEVDPSIGYETIVREFASRFKLSKSVVFAFTWRGGPIYSVLSSLGGVQIFSMSSQVAYPRPTGQGNEFSVPQNDSAVLLDLTAKTLQSNSGRRIVMIFDSVSDLVLSLGFEESYSFLKAQKEILAKESSATSLFILKKHAQDEKVLSLIKGLYTDHLYYGSNGLVITREM